MAKRLCRDKASAQDKGPRVLVAARARRGARGVSVTGSCMGRTPTTLTDPRTSMSVCLSGEPAIGPERTKALTSGAHAHYTLKLGPRIYGPRRCLYLCPGGLCFPDPTSAGGSFPPSRAGGFLRRERPVVEERRRARAACDLEGNRAGLGCLEHLGNALSFAVVTEWPVRVYPRRRCRSPPHACLAGGWPIPPVRVYVGSK